MVTVQISLGEFLDKLTVLEIKQQRFADPAQLVNVRRELAMLRAAWAQSEFAGRQFGDQTAKLRHTNESLWDIENRIRGKEAAGVFDAEFVELARSVYLVNDQRSSIKRELNVMVGSKLIEEKSYEQG